MINDRDKELFLLAMAFADAVKKSIAQDSKGLDEDTLNERVEKASKDMAHDRNPFVLMFLPDNLSEIPELLEKGTPLQIPDMRTNALPGKDEIIEIDVEKYIESGVGFECAEVIAKMLRGFYQGQKIPDEIVPVSDKTIENHDEFEKKGYPVLAGFFKPSI